MNILNSISPILQYALMLGCTAVVVCFFIRQYNRGTDIQDKDGRIQKLHTFYVSGILVFIIPITV